MSYQQMQYEMDLYYMSRSISTIFGPIARSRLREKCPNTEVILVRIFRMLSHGILLNLIVKQF